MKIAIASGKGGTGKTTLATNLAMYLSQSRKTVLVDIDVEEPNSGLFLNGELIHKEDKYKMIPEWNSELCTRCGICQKVCNFHAVIQITDQIMVFPELCHSCYACSELCPASALPMKKVKMGELKQFKQGHLNFIESRLDIGQEQAVPLIKQTKEFIDNHFDDNLIKIYDSPPGTSCPVIEATKNADLVILVTEPTPFGLHDLKLAVETMKELKKKFAVVINRDGIGDNKVTEYCSDNGISVIGKIPNSRKIAELYSQGKPIFTEIKEFRLQIEMIITYLKYIFQQNIL
jgi:MinD superfamily P-loop ATPase